MHFRHLLIMAPFIATVLSLEDCCFEATTSGGTSLKYRSNAQEGVFYDVPQNENDGSGSFCGLKITRPASNPDNCAAATFGVYDGYCSGVNPSAVTCTSAYKVRTSG